MKKRKKKKQAPLWEISGAACSCSDYETSMRCNSVMERETLRAASNSNIQQFLQRWQRAFNVAVWETCINPSLLWVSPAWKIEQGSAIKHPAQHGAGKLSTKLVHAPSHAARSVHRQSHKNKTRLEAEKNLRHQEVEEPSDWFLRSWLTKMDFRWWQQQVWDH